MKLSSRAFGLQPDNYILQARRGLHVLLAAFALLACSCPAWAGYAYVRTMTIDHTRVPNTDQSNFPVLVSKTDATLKTVANGGHVQNANGYDIGFFSASNCTAALFWEMEFYDGAAGTVTAWVKLPTVSHTADTVFYMCYGDPAITTFQSTASSVWDASFKGVWHHPNGATLSGADSTANANTETIGSGVTATAGQMDGGAAFNGAASAYTTASLGGILYNQPWTISLWSRLTQSPALVNMWSARDSNGAFFGTCYWYNSRNGMICTRATGDDPHSTEPTVNPTITTLHYWVFIYDGSSNTMKIYIDGVDRSGSGGYLGPVDTGNNHLRLSYGLGGGYESQMTADELRLSNIARSADWIATEYNNQSSPASFVLMGPEPGPAPGVVSRRRGGLMR